MPETKRVKINFDKGVSFKTLVSPELHGLFVDMSFEIEGKPVLPDMGPGDYYADWAYYFFDRCLSILPDLLEGKPGSYRVEQGLPEWLEYVFTPSEEGIEIRVVNEHGIVVSGAPNVCLQDLAREVIRASEEIVKYALSVEPELKDGTSTAEFFHKISSTKRWFDRAFGEKL